MKTTVGFCETAIFPPPMPRMRVASARSASQTACELESSFLLEPVAQAPEDGLRGRDADVGREQDLFDLIGDLRVELFFAREKAREPPEKARFPARLGETLAQTRKIARRAEEARTWPAWPSARGGRFAPQRRQLVLAPHRLLLLRLFRGGLIWQPAWSTRASFGSPGLRRPPASST